MLNLRNLYSIDNDDSVAVTKSSADLQILIILLALYNLKCGVSIGLIFI